MRRTVLGLAASVVLIGAAPADATVVYVKNLASTRYQPSVWALTDAGATRRVATGTNPRVSPDGTQVAYATAGTKPTYRLDLRVSPVAGGPARTLLRGLSDLSAVRWSPDGRTLTALTGSGIGASRLMLLDVATGTARQLARGYVNGVSFSPDGASVLWSRTAAERNAFQGGDLYVAAVAGGAPMRLTRTDRAMYPLWGPSRIAWSQVTRRRNDAPRFQIWTMDPDGTDPRQVTRTKVPTLVSGLTATAWSPDGTRLLTQFGGQDTSYAVAVDPASGSERVLGRRSEFGLQAVALSKDGSTVLGSTGGPDGPNPDVVTVPWTGGRATVLVRRAFSPDWNR